MLLIDAANVVGSRPDGWWRDRAGAASRFCESVRSAVAGGRLDAPVVVVLEGAARGGAPAGEADGIRVVHAPADGDSTLVELARAADDDPVLLVSSDRKLGELARQAGAEVVGAGWLLERLTE